MPKSGTITKDKALDDPRAEKIRRVNTIIDLMFDSDTAPSPELHARFAKWLADPCDADIKEEALQRKFAEAMEGADGIAAGD